MCKERGILHIVHIGNIHLLPFLRMNCVFDSSHTNHWTPIFERLLGSGKIMYYFYAPLLYELPIKVGSNLKPVMNYSLM
jgi:hypothetical protein